MANKYVTFVSDEHLLTCVGNLHKSYIKAKGNLTKKQLYKNKIDTIKLSFDSGFNDISQEDLIEIEILRQIDKSINNSIGTFHEQVLGGVEGFESGKRAGYDIKAQDDSLFAEVKNKHNTMSSNATEAVYQRLARYADDNRKATCYLVQILAKKSFQEHWSGIINRKEYNHSRVFKISGDRFYALLTGRDDAFAQLYKALPTAIKDYLASIEQEQLIAKNTALEEIKEGIVKSKRSILDQITFENYGYYLEFKRL